MSNPWQSGIIVSKRGFTCAYCGKKRKGAYRWVDGERSCERCNREYDAKPEIKEVVCPLCKGKGVLRGDDFS